MKNRIIIIGSLVFALFFVLLPVTSAVQQPASEVLAQHMNKDARTTILGSKLGLIFEVFEFLLGIMFMGTATGGALYLLGKMFELPSEVTNTYFMIYMLYFIVYLIYRQVTYDLPEL